MEEQVKEVRFDIYCEKCKYQNLSEQDDPCWDCLNQGYNFDTHRPINFEEAPGK